VYSIPHATDNLLVQLYKKARVFVFPSLYEGFGLPVLEAMQCGCPTLLSNNSSLPEVGGAAACYFDPFKEGDLGTNLKRMLSDSSYLAQLKQEETAQLARFTWEHTAAGHIQVYKKILA
jgi:glycosyltransferase involved in cell wall biosynthesis